MGILVTVEMGLSLLGLILMGISAHMGRHHYWAGFEAFQAQDHDAMTKHAHMIGAWRRPFYIGRSLFWQGLGWAILVSVFWGVFA